MAKRPKYDELKKRVEALEKENRELGKDLARTRALLENLGNPMGVFDSEGVLLMMNRSSAANLNGAPEDFVGKCITDIIPESGQVYLERIRKTFTTGSHAQYKDQVTLPSGKKWFLSTYEVAKDENGTPFGVRIVSVDITERKRTREILLRSEERLRALYQADPTAAFTWQKKGEDFVLVDCNHAADVLTQGRAARFFGKAAGEIYRNRPDIVHDLHQCLAERKTTRRQMWSERFLPGRLIDVTYAFVPHDLIMVHVQDITDQKRAEEEIAERSRLLEAIFTNHLTCLVLLDRDFNFIRVNEAYARACNREVSEFPGHNHFEFYPSEARSIFEEVVRTKKPFQISARPFVFPDHPEWGVTYWDWTLVPILDRAGEVEFLVFSLNNVSERVQAETALRERKEYLTQLMNTLGDAVFTVGVQERRIEYVNRAATTIFGYLPEEMIGQATQMFYPDDAGSAAFGQRLQDALAQGQKQFSAELKLRRKDGQPVWGEVQSTFLLRDGQPSAVISVVRDLTERKRAEADLLQTREQLFQAQKMETLGTLVAGVAHEINNPINLIMFNAPLLRRIWHDLQPVIEESALMTPQRKYGGLSYEFLRSDLDRLLEDMELAGKKAAAIVKGLKGFSRKSDVAEKRPMALNEAVENAIRMAKATVTKSGVQVKVDLSTALPPMHGNMQSIEQIVLNILLNGVQAIKHDHGVIEVRTGYDEQRGRLSLHISDNGEGIDPSLSGRIFDPFFTSRQAEGGTGLGLAVTHSLVEAHEGEITFESEPGKGTVFQVFFPLWPRSKKIKVLAVDDDEFALDIIKRAFDKVACCETETALSGTEALIKLGAHAPDVLILDLSMPGMDGVEVCRVVQRDQRLSHMKVITITGFPHDPRLEEMKKMGYGHIYVKPLRMKELVEEVGKIVDRDSGSVIRAS